jgi:hypothetical protein
MPYNIAVESILVEAAIVEKYFPITTIKNKIFLI